MATNNAAEMIPRIAIKGTLGVSGPLNSDYDALINKPQINGNELVGNKTNAELGIPTELADLTEDSTHRVVTDEQISAWNNKSDFSGSYNDLTDKPTIPDELADLTDDSTHRLVTDTEKETWNAKSDFSGSYDDLTDVPEDLVEDAEYVHTDNNYTSAEKTKLGDIESGAEVNVQADWNETDTSSDAYIQNKPTIPAAQVNSDWNASSGVAEILHKPTLGTAAAKNYTGSVLENSTDLVESGAVKTAIDNAISSVYKPAGNKACAELVSALLIAANLGNVYNMTDDGVTTADFVEGAGKAIEAGDNVVIVDIGSSVYKFDLLSGMVDLSNYVQKSSTSGLIKNDGTIDQTAYAKQNEMSVSTSGDQTTIQLKNGTSATVINAHQDISGKVDKEQGKGLSTNDFTNTYKDKLDGISENANKVESSETNGHIEIDDVDTVVYDDTDIQNAIEDIDDIITTDETTIEGNPINFSTLSAQKSKSTILSCEPIQDLHGYDKPWVGGAGKNLFGGQVSISNVFSYAFELPSSATIITISAKSSTSKKVNAKIYKSDGTTLIGDFNFINAGATSGYVTQTLTEQGFIVVYVVNGDSSDIPKVTEVQVEIGNQPTSYEPYENICPISGRSEIGILGCGKNLFDKMMTLVPDQYIKADGTIGSLERYCYTVNYIDVIPNTTYTTSGKVTDEYTRNAIAFYDMNKNFISRYMEDHSGGVTFTTPQNAYFVRFNMYTPDIDTVQLEQGSSATDYSPYQKSTDLTISLGQTVYGGTLDVENGVLVVKKGFETFDGSNDEEWFASNIEHLFNINTDLPYIEGSAGTIIPNWLSNVGQIYREYTNAKAYTHTISYGNTYLNYVNSSVSLVSDLRTYLSNNPIQVCYELATPITVNLTPHTIKLLEGVNNISTDGDKITLTYRDGKVATLGDLTSAVDNLDSKIDESKILTDTVTGDKYILVVTNGVLSVEQISN